MLRLSYRDGKSRGNGSLLKYLVFLMTYIKLSVIINTVLLICFDCLIIWKEGYCRSFMSIFGHVQLERAYSMSKAFLEGLTSQSSVSEFVSKLEFLEFQRDRLLLGHQASAAMFSYYFNQRTVFHYPRIYVKLWIRFKNQQKLLVVERL